MREISVTHFSHVYLSTHQTTRVPFISPVPPTCSKFVSRIISLNRKSSFSRVSRMADPKDSDFCSSSKAVILDSQGVPHHPPDLVTKFVPLKELQPLAGDLIEFKRDLYSHWGLFVGDGQVVHVRGGIQDSEISLTGKANVQMDALSFVAGGSKVRINNQEAQAEMRGLKPHPLEKLLDSAKNMVGKQVPYDLLKKNCEHYVTEWRYGKSWSDQVESGMKQLGALAHDARKTDLPQMMDVLQNMLNARRNGNP